MGTVQLLACLKVLEKNVRSTEECYPPSLKLKPFYFVWNGLGNRWSDPAEIWHVCVCAPKDGSWRVSAAVRQVAPP